MNLKSFINNKYTLVGSIVFYLTGVYLTSRFATYLPCEGSPGILFPSAEKWLSSSPLSNHSVNSILILSGGILLLRINNLFSLIQKHTLLLFLFFLLLEVCSPSLSLLCNGNIMAVVLTMILFPFFSAYQQERAQPAFLMMGIISLCTLFCPKFAYYIPLFIIGFAQIRYFTLKSLLGAFIGFATPFWVLIGIGIMPFSGLSALIPDFTFHIPETLPFNDPQFWTIVLTALLGLFSGTATLYTTFNEKRQTRAYNGFINLLSVYSAILLIIDYRNYTLYLPVLNMAVAMQAAFFFTNNTKKYGVVLFYLILTLYTGLFVWNLLPV